MSLTQHELELKQRFEQQRGIWTPEWEALAKSSPAYLDGYIKIQAASQDRQRLPAKIQEFCYIAVAASVTHIHLPAVKAHIQAALALGATTDELIEVIGMTYLLGVHTVTLGFPILQQLMKELDIPTSPASTSSSSATVDYGTKLKTDFIQARGFWPVTFQPLVDLDPTFFEQYLSFSSFSSRSKVLDPKYREIIICGFDAATTHLYARGTEIHMRNALKLGATPDEIIEMLEITSLMGIDGVVASAPLLLDEVRKLTRGH